MQRKVWVGMEGRKFASPRLYSFSLEVSLVSHTDDSGQLGGQSLGGRSGAACEQLIRRRVFEDVHKAQ